MGKSYYLSVPQFLLLQMDIIITTCQGKYEDNMKSWVCTCPKRAWHRADTHHKAISVFIPSLQRWWSFRLKRLLSPGWWPFFTSQFHRLALPLGSQCRIATRNTKWAGIAYVYFHLGHLMAECFLQNQEVRSAVMSKHIKPPIPQDNNFCYHPNMENKPCWVWTWELSFFSSPTPG